MNKSKPSPEPSLQGGGHSTREIEHRFTELEMRHQASLEDRNKLFNITGKHSEKLTLHERILLGLLIALATLLQDKLPVLALALKALLNS